MNVEHDTSRLREYVDEEWEFDPVMRRWVCPHGQEVSQIDADYGEQAFFELMKGAHDAHFLEAPPVSFGAAVRLD